MITNTIIKVGTSFTPNDTKKYPKYVGRKLLFASSISSMEALLKLSGVNLEAIKKLNAVRTIGTATKIPHEK